MTDTAPTQGGGSPDWSHFDPAQLDPAQLDAYNYVESALANNPDISTYTQDEVRELSRNLDILNKATGETSTFAQLEQSRKLGTPTDSDLLKKMFDTNVIQMPPHRLEGPTTAIPSYAGNEMLNNPIALTIFMVMYDKIISEKEHELAMGEMAVETQKLFREYVDEIAKHIISIGKERRMQHIAQAASHFAQAGMALTSAAATAKAGIAANRSIKADQARLSKSVHTKQQQYEAVDGRNKNYKMQPAQKANNQPLTAKEIKETQGTPFNQDPKKNIGDGMKEKNIGPQKDPDDAIPDPQNQKEAKRIRDKIDADVAKHKQLEGEFTGRLQQKLFMQQSLLELGRSSVQGITEVISGMIEMRIAELEAEKAEVEGAKDLTSRLLDSIVQSQNMSRDEVKQAYDYLQQTIRSMQETFGGLGPARGA